MIFKTSILFAIFQTHYLLILNGNQSQQDLFLNIKQKITPFIISPEQVNEQDYGFTLTVFCNNQLASSMNQFGQQICSPNSVKKKLKDLNSFLKEMTIQIQKPIEQDQFTLTYLLSFKDQNQIEQEFYYKQNFMFYQKIPLELKNLIISQTQLEQDNKKVLILEIKNSFYQLTESKNLQIVYNDPKPKDLNLKFHGNKLYAEIGDNYKENTPLKLNFYVKDTKTKFDSQNIQVEITGNQLLVSDDFFYRAFFVFAFFLFTLLVIFYIIWQMINFDNESDKQPQQQIVVEGGPVKVKVLSDSILHWNKAKKYDNTTTFKGESMFEDYDHLDEEQSLKEKKFKFNIMDEVSIINSKEENDPKNSFIDDIDIKNIN